MHILRQAITNLAAHKLRAFLTMIGIVTGIAATVFLMSLINGVEHDVRTRFEHSGGRLISVRAAHRPKTVRTDSFI